MGVHFSVDLLAGSSGRTIHVESVRTMKAEIHPNYLVTTVRCSCGNSFETRSTRGGDLNVELCNECHPYFTGKQKLVDTGGRVERFNKRYGSRKAKA